MQSKKNTISLSPRLHFLAKQVIPDQDVWDICCDHGLLGLWLLKNSQAKIFFVDQVESIIYNLKQKLSLLNDEQHSRVEVYCCDGHQIQSKLSGNVIVAGVGGEKIISFIKTWLEDRKLQAQRLILSPHKDELLLLNFLKETFSPEAVTVHSVVENKRERPVYVVDLGGLKSINWSTSLQ